MRYLCLPLGLLAALLSLAQCQLRDPAPIRPEDQLPPATQTGANTFGCLVNGQPWTPRGYNGTSNYAVSYDSGLNNGLFALKTYRYPETSQDFQSIYLGVLSDCRLGTYFFQSAKKAGVRYYDTKTACDLRSGDSTTTYSHGSLTITRLDLTNGIIAGTFAFTLYKPGGCDSVRVTQGRFDKRL